jgi:hypothetical protein
LIGLLVNWVDEMISSASYLVENSKKIRCEAMKIDYFSLEL